MTIKIIEINRMVKDGLHIVTFKHWIEGDCACGAIRAVRSFDHEPTEKELIESI